MVFRVLPEAWQRRRRLGGLWWRGLGAVGLSRERFRSWPGWQQRAGRVALGGVVAFLLSILVNTLEHYFGEVSGASILTFDASAYIAFAVVALLVVPEWKALPAFPLRLVIPVALVVAGIGG